MPWTLVGTIPGSGSGGSGWTDAYTFGLEVGVADTNTTPSEILDMFADASHADTNAAQSESVEFGASAPLDTNATPTESRDSFLVRWATSHTTSGTAPTNPTNAYGSNDGTTAIVKAGGTTTGTSTLTLTIAAPLSEITAGQDRTLRAYFRCVANTAGSGDTRVAQVSYRRVGQGTNTTVGMSTGSFTATEQTASLTNIDPTFPVTVAFTHSSTAAITGGNLTVDAVGIETTGAL